MESLYNKDLTESLNKNHLLRIYEAELEKTNISTKTLRKNFCEVFQKQEEIVGCLSLFYYIKRSSVFHQQTEIIRGRNESHWMLEGFQDFCWLNCYKSPRVPGCCPTQVKHINISIMTWVAIPDFTAMFTHKRSDPIVFSMDAVRARLCSKTDKTRENWDWQFPCWLLTRSSHRSDTKSLGNILHLLRFTRVSNIAFMFHVTWQTWQRDGTVLQPGQRGPSTTICIKLGNSQQLVEIQW